MKESIVLIHLGEDIPDYLETCIHQIRLWNDPSQVDIFLIVFDSVGETIAPMTAKHSVRVVLTSTLKPSETHLEFLQTYKNYDPKFRNNYWRHVIERFYFLEELMRDYNLESVVHMEYDVLLYEDLSVLGPVLREHIPHMALPFDNDQQGYASFMIINSLDTLEMFNGFILTNCNENNITDMKLLSMFRRNYPDFFVGLPLIPKALYDAKPERKSWNNTIPKYGAVSFICNLFEELGTRLFDAIAIGQYIGGIDPRNQNGKYFVEFINESSFYSVLEFGLNWKKDEKERWYLVSKFPDEHKIVNVHIHSKMLSYFVSDREDMPKADYKGVEIIKFDQGNCLKDGRA
jgi:hypothetical protein